jgi:acyl-CoA thioesterase I
MKPEKTIIKIKAGLPVTIAALGDSLTAGWLEKKGYLDFLNEMLLERFSLGNINIINKGVPGDTAFGGLNRLEKDILQENPDLVFVQFALNDAFTGYSPSEFSMNIKSITDRIRDKTSADIVLITSTYLGFVQGGDLADIFYNVLEKISERNTIPIVKVHEYWKKNIPDKNHYINYVQDDLLHPNEAGYRLMADAIMEIFSD